MELQVKLSTWKLFYYYSTELKTFLRIYANHAVYKQIIPFDLWYDVYLL